MSSLLNVSDRISKQANYRNINKLTNTNLRNRKINCIDLILSFVSYTSIGSTHQSITSSINMESSYDISRQALIKKQENFPIEFFELFSDIILDENNKINKNPKIIAIDGTYNNNYCGQVMSNIGLFDINNNMPIDLKFTGSKRNNEVKEFTKYIKNNIDLFKDNIIVGDRAYYSFDFIDFLTKNNINYIIRVKKNGDTLNPNKKLSAINSKNQKIINIRKTSRIVNFEKLTNKKVRTIHKKYTKIVIKTDCTMITNLSENKFSDEEISDLYNKRWDVELFFKLIKNNFKFQYINEKSDTKYKKIYAVVLILIHIAKLLEKEYMMNKKVDDFITDKNGKKVKCTVKINLSNIIKGLIESNFIKLMLKGQLSMRKINIFMKSYIIIKKNKLDRSFSRKAKRPFSKWHLKGYSEINQYGRIIDALLTDTVDKLNKNLKLMAKRIVKIGRKKFN